MRSRDSDIPPALQGDLSLVVADIGGLYVYVRHPLEDSGVNDPQFHVLPVHLRLRGISAGAADKVAAILDAIADDAPPPSRDDLLRRILADTLSS